MGTTLIRLLPADGCRPDRGSRVRTETCADAGDFERGQIPLPSLLLATVLSASLWWGILAGVRWIWLAV